MLSNLMYHEKHVMSMINLLFFIPGMSWRLNVNKLAKGIQEDIAIGLRQLKTMKEVGVDTIRALIGKEGYEQYVEEAGEEG